ncbi:GntR family transcriptional regulator [Paenibacillus montaniterrae]|uniref:GntR family transcriptional regulator n=2 Tax=Paenibacillus montaniterrae TaxID=429341 RepID=A0A920CYF4_9BACL|nr:GntR family transcriptional regulator [Paenibacillus montaniterrae]
MNQLPHALLASFAVLYKSEESDNMNINFPVELKQVSAKKISDFVYEQLEEAIILKELMPNQQLPTERELAQTFNASRMVVREALSRLEESGLIYKKVGAKGGTFVQPVTLHSHLRSPQEIREKWDRLSELFEFRSFIEPEAAFLAAGRVTAEQLSMMESYIVLSSSEECTRELFRALDVKFHLEIAKASGNFYLERAVRMIRTQINPALDLMPYNEEVRQTNLSKHEQLLEAMKNRDQQLAKALMTQHIAKSSDSIYAQLTRDEQSI